MRYSHAGVMGGEGRSHCGKLVAVSGVAAVVSYYNIFLELGGWGLNALLLVLVLLLFRRITS